MIPLAPFAILFGAFFALRKKPYKSSSQMLDSESIEVLSNDNHSPTTLDLTVGESMPIQAILKGVGVSWDFVSYSPGSKAVVVSSKIEDIGGGSTSQTFTIRAVAKGSATFGFKKRSANNIVLDERFLSVNVI